MAKLRTSARLDAVLDAALYTFLESGYRGATLLAVAERAGVSVGSIYSYAQSKEALFELVLRTALHEPKPDVVELPFVGAHGTDLVTWVWERLQSIDPSTTLAEAAEQPAPDDPLAELERLIRGIWAWQSSYWQAVELIERCAKDWPELYMLYYKQFRRGAFGHLTKFLDRRMEEGALRRYADPATALRVIIENIAFFAMHRHIRPDSSELEEEVSRETVVAILIAGFTPQANGGEQWGDV